MTQVDILPVNSLSRFASFCRLPRQLYKDMRGFSPPIDLERWTLFSHRLNPHYKLVEEQKFLARSNGQWVGRISAQVYNAGISPIGASPCQFGALDVIDDIDVTHGLLMAAENWLREKGADRITGPFSPTINGECGVLVQGFDATPMIFMPWHPPYLSQHLDALGYAKARDLISYKITVAEHDLDEKPRVSSRKEWRERLNLRPLNMAEIKTKETPILEELFNDSWRGNWGYVPFTKAEFDSTADALKFVMPSDFGIVAELDGKPQSFVIALPNLFEIFSDLQGRLFPFGLARIISRMRSHKFKSARIVLLGTRKALQNSATGGAILMSMFEEMKRRGASMSIQQLEAGWVLEDNMSMRRPIEMFGGKIDKIHRIYEKLLVDKSDGGDVDPSKIQDAWA